MAVSVASMARKCFAVAVAGAAAMGRAATRLLCETDAQSIRLETKMLQEEIFSLHFTKKQNFPKMVGRRVFPLGTQFKDPLFRPFISQFTAASASSSWGRPSPWAPSHDTRSIRDLRGCRDAGAAMAMLSPTTSTLQPKLSSLNSVWTGGIALAPIMMAHG